MTTEEIKRYFEAAPPPKEVDWKPWAKITDSQAFLKSCYATIKNYKGSLDMYPAWWHLKDFYMLMRANAQQISSENQSEQP